MPSPGRSEGSWTPSTSSTPTGVFGQEQVPVEVNVVAEAGDGAGRSDRQAGLDHAPDHDAQLQGAGGVDHPDGLAQPPLLASLMLIPWARSAQGLTSARVWQSSST